MGSVSMKSSILIDTKGGTKKMVCGNVEGTTRNYEKFSPIRKDRRILENTSKMEIHKEATTTLSNICIAILLAT